MSAREQPPEPLVETAPLSGLLAEFVADWKRTRPSTKGHRNLPADAIEPVGPYEWLAADTGIPEQTLRNIRHADRKPTVELGVAERIVFAIGDPAMLYDGTLTVRVNPSCPAALRASAEREAAAWNHRS